VRGHLRIATRVALVEPGEQCLVGGGGDYPGHPAPERFGLDRCEHALERGAPPRVARELRFARGEAEEGQGPARAAKQGHERLRRRGEHQSSRQLHEHEDRDAGERRLQAARGIVCDDERPDEASEADAR